MHLFEYKNGEIYCEGVRLARIAAEVGTPVYVYSAGTLAHHFNAFDSPFSGVPHITCYSVKSNSNVSVIRLFAGLGSGVDIVSGGELFRALKAGVDPQKIVFSGVGKQRPEMDAALAAGILMFNVESHDELVALDAAARAAGKRARISLRVNPDVDPATHPYLATGLKKSKFGIPIAKAFDGYLHAKTLPGIEIAGIDCHIGSQVTSVEPFVDAIRKVLVFTRRLSDAAIALQYFDIGGGLGITYDEEKPPHPVEYAGEVIRELADSGFKIIFEPGRVIVGNAGVLVTRALYPKENEAKRFVVVDAAMNDLIRPSLYGAFHAIKPVVPRDGAQAMVDVVGPVCESGDFLAQDRLMPPVERGDLLAVMSAGAYGFSMASNYNSRPRPAEVLVEGDTYRVIRERETLEDLVRGETPPQV
ncbi:MAG: diaminopimelate decarboxylase [Deltaproteobacteria bacterium]|nr:diaminopimelate decarboxylase [Deltaproteobacteria bacterium]